MRKWLVRIVALLIFAGAVAAVCVLLAPLWLTIALTSLVAAGFLIQWVCEDFRAAKWKGG